MGKPDFNHALVFAYGLVENNSGISLQEFECQVVCLCVIYVCVCVRMCAVLSALTSGTSVIGVVSPQAFS